MRLYLSLAALWLTMSPLHPVLAQGGQGGIAWERAHKPRIGFHRAYRAEQRHSSGSKNLYMF
jgi:hypothetical protein